MNLSGNAIKNSKKKSHSIDKKAASTISSDTQKKTIPKKGSHKKSKSYATNNNLSDAMNSQQQHYGMYQQNLRMRDHSSNMASTLEQSFVQNSINKSYERLLAETLQDQNYSMIPGSGTAQYPKYIGVSKKITGGSGTVKHQDNKRQNVSLQFNSKRGAGSANVSQSRFNVENYEVVNREKAHQGYQSNKSSRKSLSNNSKLEQQVKKKSRRSDQFMINVKSKAESNRTSKKNSPNHTINSSKANHLMREAKTKPTSPERSLVLINGYKPQGNYNHQKKKSEVVMVQGVNSKEERKALNMISNIGKPSKNTSSALGYQQIIKPQQENNLAPNQTTKRKNFKNMFYSPKGGRDAFTEPHSKLHSQAQTKEHSPMNRASAFENSQNLKQSLPNTQSNTIGHHPQIRTSAKPPTSFKNNKMIYSTKDSNKKEIQNGISGMNSFLEESYLKNVQVKKEDISFDSSSNQYSQTGTPLSYKVKFGSIQGGLKKVKNLNVINTVNVQQIPPTTIQSSSLEKKPKKMTLQQTSFNKINSQVQSPSYKNGQYLYDIQPQHKFTKQSKPQRFQSEAPSPVNFKHHINEMPQNKKRGISIGGLHEDSLSQSKILVKSGKYVVQQNKNMPNQNQQQFLFNQYVNTKKNRMNALESVEGSLERQAHSQFKNEPFFDQQINNSKKEGDSPRTKEVDLIKTLIQECFDKYGKPPKTQLELYKIGKMLGKGAFGRVNLGLQRLTRRLVAIKAINMEFMKDETSKKKMSNEISILKILRHPNVVKLLETFDTDKHHLIVMELCPGGDLLNYVRKRRKLNEKYAKFVFKQIMEGIAYLHQNGVVHRDIKLDNILLDGHGNIKIADFGVSRKVVNNEILFEQCGTPAYIAPEIVRELGYKGYPVDIWSAGVCLYAMLYGNVPFKANQMGDLNKMILDATIEFKDTASEESRDLMVKMLQKSPNKRLTAEEVLDHPWFDDVDDQINIFDEQELDLIKKEFTYVSQKAKLKELKQRKPEDLNTEFTEHSINSNENTLLKNNSSRSVILCPFNTQAGAQAKSIYEDIQDMLIDKDMVIRFDVRVRECDRQYEKFNNQDFDNGVYHKYAYNQGKNKDQDKDDDNLKEDVIDKDDVGNQNLVRKRDARRKPEFNFQNYYLRVDEKIVDMVQEYGFPRSYVMKCLGDNLNNHCTTSYYLLCMDQNY